MCKVVCKAVAAGTAPQNAVRGLAADGFAKAGFQIQPQNWGRKQKKEEISMKMYINYFRFSPKIGDGNDQRRAI